MDVSAALPTFAVALREGVEAALVVGIVLACLKKAERSQLNPWVYAGVIAGIAASAALGVLISGVLQRLDTASTAYASVWKQFLEASFGAIAVCLLAWMLLWMTQQARAMKASVEGAISAALQQSRGAAWGIFSLIFIAVLREGVETVLFIVAQFQQGIAAALGALAGLLGAAGVGVLLFQWGVRIDLRKFFQVMGILLLLIVAGLLVSVLKHFDAGLLTLSQVDGHFADLCFSNSATCWLGPQVWDAGQVLPDSEFPGILLKALFGYREVFYLGQAIAYLAFLAGVGGYYFRQLTAASRSRPSTTTVPTASDSPS